MLQALNSHIWLVVTVLDNASLEYAYMFKAEHKVALRMALIMNLPIKYSKPPWVFNIHLSYFITT